MISPLKSIRKKCLDCSGFERQRVKECDFDGISINRNGLVEDHCPLHQFRMGHGKGSKVRAIRKYCLWCSIDQPNEVKLCPSIFCKLYQFRFGHNPNCSGRKGGNASALENYRRNRLIESNSMSGIIE